jgi:putative endonuclease
VTKQRKTLGNKGEDLAAQYLTKHNYTIISRNSRSLYGEIDIIAKLGDDIILVEVKTKTNFTQGEAVELIGPKKIRKLKTLAKNILQQYPNKNIRVDAIAIDWSKSNPQLEHIQNIILDF